MTTLTILDAVRNSLMLEMSKDKSVVILGQDVGKNGGVFRATDGLQQTYGKSRVIDTPISEAAIAGMTLGAAAAGLKPVAEIQFSGFLYGCVDHILNHISRIRTRSQGRFTAPLVIRTPYGGGIRALEHHSESYEALYAHIPGLKVVIPSTPTNTKGLLTAAIRDPDPVLFMEPKRVYRAIKEELDEKKEVVTPLGQAHVEVKGNDLTLISWGAMMKECRNVVRDSQHDIELIDMQTIYPYDKETIINSAKKTGRVVIVQEAHRSGGFASELSQCLNESCLYHLEKPVRRITGYDVPFPLFQNEQRYMPHEPHINSVIDEVMSQ